MSRREAKSITDIIEQVKEDMCDKYCRYTHEPTPEGKDADWLFDDDDFPCKECPLNRL